MTEQEICDFLDQYTEEELADVLDFVEQVGGFDKADFALELLDEARRAA